MQVAGVSLGYESQQATGDMSILQTLELLI